MTKNRPISDLLVLACVGLMLCAATAIGQTTFASITGVVVDASGSVVPNAEIVATEVNTNVSTSSKSNEVGNYTVAQLKEGTYRVVARSAGFKEFVAKDVVLAARDIRRIDVRLESAASIPASRSRAAPR